MRYAVVANGPFLPKPVIDEIVDGCLIVALDGAADRLLKLGITPDVIIGDFDSINREFWDIEKSECPDKDDKRFFGKPRHSKYGVVIIPAFSQYHTDLEKAIHFCDNPNKVLNTLDFKIATSIDILCAIEGRLDHTIDTIRQLSKTHKRERPLRIHTDSQTIFFAKDEQIEIKGKKEDKIGLISAPKASFISKGLRWDGISSKSKTEDSGPDGYRLYYGHESTCNVLDSDSVRIKVTGGAIIIAPGMLNSQRMYSDLSRLDQLKLLLVQEQYKLLDTTIGDLKRDRDIKKKVKGKVGLVNKHKDIGFKSIYYLFPNKTEFFQSQSLDESVLVSMHSNRYKMYSIFKAYTPEEIDESCTKSGNDFLNLVGTDGFIKKI